MNTCFLKRKLSPFFPIMCIVDRLTCRYKSCISTSVGVVAGLEFFKGARTINKHFFPRRFLFDMKLISSL